MNFYASLENVKNCDISAAAWPINKKFGMMVHNNDLEYKAVKNFNFENWSWQLQMADLILKIEKSRMLTMMQNGSLKHIKILGLSFPQFHDFGNEKQAYCE